jgi:hypothetical protein
MSPGAIASGPGIEHTGDLETRVTRLENWINFLQNFEAYPIIPEQLSLTAAGSGTFLGGISVPWSSIRRLFQIPADRWDGWLSGVVISPGSAVNLRPGYTPNSGTTIPLMAVTTVPAGSFSKVQIGPFPVRGPLAQALGVPAGENVLVINLLGGLATAGQTAQLSAWTLWIRQSPTRS